MLERTESRIFLENIFYYLTNENKDLPTAISLSDQRLVERMPKGYQFTENEISEIIDYVVENSIWSYESVRDAIYSKLGYRIEKREIQTVVQSRASKLILAGLAGLLLFLLAGKRNV